jgi:crotonobetainyl-CoA:carnitine CoA-transferase CaiB-like acyl-CoA transferase
MVPPLTGVTVVSIEQAVAAPFATRQLADLGARVIKIERPDGGDFARAYDTTVNGQSSYFVWLNRSKQSITIDLKSPGATPILDRLMDAADVFVQNLAHGATDRMGLSTRDLRARYPRLVICNISGYGSSGPLAQKKAYDLLIQAETGAIATTGTPDTPSKVGISIADIAAGMYAHSGILAALYARQTSNQGCAIDVSLFDALGEWMSAPMYYTRYGGTPPARSGAAHASIAPYGPFATGADGTVLLGVQNQREWERFCTEVLQQPALAVDARFKTNPLRVQHRDALTAIINEVFRTLPTAEVVQRLDAAGIANGRLNDVQGFATHPQLAGRDRWHEVETPGGPIDALKPPAIVTGLDPVMGPVPALGEHTDQVLHDLGFEDGIISQWRRRGLI